MACLRTRRLLAACLVTLLFLAWPAAALAHGDRPHSRADLVRAWEFEPGIVIPLVLSGWLYVRGVRRLWRATRPGSGIRRWEAACYALGWIALAVALVSPLHPWGRVLFSVHMTQHEILMLVADPLLVLGRPMIAFLKALPKGWARRCARFGNSLTWRPVWNTISNPFAAWIIHALALWCWHIPGLFQATLDDELVHAVQHLSFVLSALLFWWAVIYGRQRFAGFGVAVLYMFSTALHSGLLGALNHVCWLHHLPGLRADRPLVGLDPA